MNMSQGEGVADWTEGKMGRMGSARARGNPLGIGAWNIAGYIGQTQGCSHKGLIVGV